MLKKLSVLLFLCALCMWAADFWIAKPFTEWNDKEVAKILSDSPWTAKVLVVTEFGSRGAGGGRSGGRGGGRGAAGDAASPDSSVSGGGGGVDGGAGLGGGGGLGGGAGRGGGLDEPGLDAGGGVSAGVTVTLIWQTALPVKQALTKRKFGAETGTSPEAKAALERTEQTYILTLIGMPGSMLAATQGDRKTALLDATMLTVSGKPPLKAADVQASGGRGSATVSFLFPRTTAFTVEDKEVEFSSKFDKTSIKKKFKLKDMVFNGKVEL